MPRTLGDTFIHVSKINYIVPVDYDLPEIPMGGPSDLPADRAHIAGTDPGRRHAADGIGGIPDGVLRPEEPKHLGVHTELFSDGVIDLVERGVINSERKSLHPGKIVAGFLLGTQRLYDFVHDNPIIELHPTEYVNDPFISRRTTGWWRSTRPSRWT